MQSVPSPISDSLLIINSLTASPLEDNGQQVNARCLDEYEDKGLSAGLWGNHRQRGCWGEGDGREEWDLRGGKYVSDDGE